MGSKRLAGWPAAGLSWSMAAQAASFANGADVSWVSQQESSGHAFYNSSGVKTDPFVLLKNLQVNAIRLRVWVNPAGGWNDGADVLYKAQRAAAQGQRIRSTSITATAGLIRASRPSLRHGPRTRWRS
jgi:hypothetical protein